MGFNTSIFFPVLSSHSRWISAFHLLCAERSITHVSHKGIDVSWSCFRAMWFTLNSIAVGHHGCLKVENNVNWMICITYRFLYRKWSCPQKVLLLRETFVVLCRMSEHTTQWKGKFKQIEWNVMTWLCQLEKHTSSYNFPKFLTSFTLALAQSSS